MAHRCKKRMCLCSCSHSCFLCTTVWFGFADSQGTVQACPQSLKGASKQCMLTVNVQSSKCHHRQITNPTAIRRGHGHCIWMLMITVRHVYALLRKIIIRRQKAAVVVVITDFPKAEFLKQQLPDCIVLAFISLCLMQISLHMHLCVHTCMSFTGLRINDMSNTTRECWRFVYHFNKTTNCET